MVAIAPISTLAMIALAQPESPSRAAYQRVE
jgi:hypothetical protein